MANRFAMTFTARPEHIDMLGHVNNAVWVQWMEAVATAHWEADARAQDIAAYVWVVTRHEIDYRGNIGAGDSVEARTFIPEGPRAARFDRRVDFVRVGEGKPIVSARTTWAMIEVASGRLCRIPAEVAAPFGPWDSEGQ
jgi:acyl-CoA thioester hydrolase